MTTSYHLTLALALGLAGCVSEQQNRTARALVGLWKSNNPNVNYVIWRNERGRFFEKKIQRYDYSKPPAEYTDEGDWWIEGRYYIFRYTHISIPKWQEQIGKTWRVEIVKVDPEHFVYVSTDGANVSENRVGVASHDVFEKATPPQLEPE